MLLFVASCDRFEHSFAPEPDMGEILMTQFNQAFSGINADNMSALEALYSENYLHYGITKTQRINWYRSFFTNADLRFEVKDFEYQKLDDNNGILSWKLKVFSGESVLADSSFTGEKVQKLADNRWNLLGNRIEAGESNSGQLVIAEYFTFRTCPNCPPAEAKLSQLQTQYPDNFIYLEHHVTMELALPGNPIPAYYQAWSQPAAVFQGREKVLGSTPDKLAQYQSNVDAYVAQGSPITYVLENTLENGNTISGVVRLTPLSSLDRTDLVLNYVIISDEHTFTNANGQPLHNVVRAVGSHSIAAADLSQPQPFSLSVRTASLPDEYTLVIFAQKKPATFENASTIYGGIKQKFTNPARRK